MTAARGLSAAVLLLSLALVVLIGWVLLAGDPRWSALLLVGDDAGYYLAIARNVCLGHGASFDRIHPTNGFNPLYTLLLVGFDRVLVPGASVLGCYRAGLLVSLLALLVGLAGLVRLLARFVDARVFGGDLRGLAVAAGIAFYAFFIVPKKQFGMDAALVLGLGTLYLDRALRGGLLAPGARAGLIDGILLGLLLLARVDNLPIVVAALGTMALLAPGRPSGFRALGQRALWAGLTVLPYVLWSTSRFGTWMPVSARIKSSFPHVDLGTSLWTIRNTSVNAADLASFLVAYLAAWIVALAALRGAPGLTRVQAIRARLGEPRAALLAMLALALVMRFTYMLAFSRTDVQGGYVMLAHVFNLLVFFAAAEALARRVPARAARVAAGAALLLIAVSLGLFAGKAAGMARHLAGPEPGDEWTLAREIQAVTKPDDVLYGGAFGLVAFFADRAWINGDGVANTYDYQRAFEHDGLAAWLRAAGVTHVVWAGPEGGPEPGAPIRLDVEGVLAGRINTIEVEPRDIVLVGRLARGLARAGGGSKVYVARWGR
jgi:hypothetical protein